MPATDAPEFSAISSAQPTVDDHRRTRLLETELRKAGRIETRAQREQRESVMVGLAELIDSWAVRVADSLPLGGHPAFAKVHILPFGSYRLGVNAPNADIDTVLVVPKHFQRERDFFGRADPVLGQRWKTKPRNILANCLREDPRVVDLVEVADGHTPIMTFVFSGIEIDIGFAQVARDYLPDTIDRVGDDLLIGADEYAARALNGTRVADAICDVVKAAGSDLETFRLALRCVKLWASRCATAKARPATTHV